MKKYLALVLACLMALAVLSGCKQEEAQPQTNPTTQQTEPQNFDPNTYYTVTFLDDNGQTVDTQQVQAGQSAVTPEYTPAEGYVFVGWNRDFSCITQDTVIDAVYSPTATQSIVVLEMKARAGETVSVPVVIVANPGIAGAKVTAIYDPTLVLTEAQSGSAFSALDYTAPGQFMSPCSFTWDSESGMVTENGQILLLTFQVPGDAPLGKTYAIKCVYTQGDIYDENLADINLSVINGSITVE